jgi:hypothetical protein
MEAERLRLGVGGAEAVAHDPGPQSPRGAELRHLLEEVVVRVEEEREPGAELRFSNVVAGDRDRVPLRQALMAVGEEIRRDPHGWLGRKDVVPTRRVLLEDVVLHSAAQLRSRDPLTLRDELVQEEQERRGCIDRHRRRDLAERDRVEEHLHVGK